MEKQTVAVLFGGQSSEHEVSCVSAVTVIENIDRDKYDVLLVGITKEGSWLLPIPRSRSAPVPGGRKRPARCSPPTPAITAFCF